MPIFVKRMLFVFGVISLSFSQNAVFSQSDTASSHADHSGEQATHRSSKHLHDSESLFAPFEERIHATTNKADQRAILKEAEQAIRNQSNATSEEKGEALMQLAHADRNLASGPFPAEFESSLRIFAEIQSMQVSDFRKVDALRMIAQTYLYIHRDGAKAATNYAKMLEIIEASTDGSLKSSADIFKVEALAKSAYTHQKEGDYTKSLSFREQIVTNPEYASPRALGLRELPALYLENGRDAARKKDFTTAVAYYDKILAEFPDYAKSKGSIVNLKYERANAFGYAPNDSKRVALLQQIWLDPANFGDLQVYKIGVEMLLISKENKDANYLPLLEEVVGRIETNYPALPPEKIKASGLEEIYKDTLLELADYYRTKRNFEAAQKRYEQLIQLFPSSNEANYAKGEIAQMKQPRKEGGVKNRYVPAIVISALILLPCLAIFTRSSIRKKLPDNNNVS